MIQDNIIISFDGAERWLSNFVDSPIDFEGRVFRSVEHAYQSAKSNSKEWKEECADWSNSAGKIKRASKDIEIISSWDTIKRDIMRPLLVSKFQIEQFRELLLNTGNMEIREGNTWGDYYWGCSMSGTSGSNHLGKMIMQIRENLRTIPLF